MLTLVKKVFYKVVGINPLVDRFVRYRNPRKYWNQRGGEGYYQEQEAVQERTLRSEYLASQLRKYNCGSLLEVGCGYGKQLRNLDAAYGQKISLTGCDFSRTQLDKCREYFPNDRVRLIEADAENIPLDSKSFDMVFTSAVILHNEPHKARRILAEIIRLSRKYLAHNEDTDITFSRYGYDLAKTYQKLGFKIHETGPIPCSVNPSITQFTVAELPAEDFIISPENIPLQYHA